jgi:O-antigen ligase
MSEGSTGVRFAPARILTGIASAVPYLAIAIGFTLPISTAADNILLALLVLCWLVSGNWRSRYEIVRANPVALAALAYLGMMVLGLAWSPDPGHDGLVYLKKYSDLLLIPILVTVFTDPVDRRRGLLALALAIALTLVMSLALSVGVLPTGGTITGDATNPTVFKRHITQNILMAFGCVLFAELGRVAGHPGVRLLWFGLAVLASFDVLFLVWGRTGYLVLAALAVLYLYTRFRWRGMITAVILVAAGFVGAYELSPSFHERVSGGVTEANRFQPGAAGLGGVRERLEFYHNTLALIRDHPVLGVGTGGFVNAYAEKVRGTGTAATRNPHNQYLMTAAEVGLVGLALLMFLFAQQWRCAARLKDEHSRTLARALILTIMVGSLFNSLLIDHVESLLFAWLSGLLFAALPEDETSRVKSP